MYTSITKDSGDVAILTLAVENVFRKLIRLLIGKISLKKLQEMVQVIFVEEAEANLRQERPGRMFHCRHWLSLPQSTREHSPG